MPSIVDVARKAQVAASTVSLVVNGRKNVSPDTRRRVQAAIADLGYVPRSRRKRQSTRASRCHVAVVYTRDAVCNGAMTRLSRSWIKGVRQVMAKQGAQPSVVAGMDRVDRDLMFQQMLEAREFEGVVLCGARANNGYLDRLLEANVPVVAMNRHPERSDVCSVAVDFHGGGSQAAATLLEFGHTRIGLLESEQSLWTSRELHRGVRKRLAEADGLEPVTIPVDGEEAEPAAIVDHMLRANVTGLCTGDHTAIGVLNELERRGVAVPQSISVIGFDNLGFVSDSGKRLTSIGFQKVRMGRLAARLLLQMISPHRRLHSATIVLPTHLVPGDTTAAPQS